MWPKNSLERAPPLALLENRYFAHAGRKGKCAVRLTRQFVARPDQKPGGISDQDVEGLNFSAGIPLVYEFSGAGHQGKYGLEQM